MAIDGRKAPILKAVIERFIQTGDPVGSKYVAQMMEISVSPATIRNEMAALEEAGLLEQPHTSSGRIPTHMGYRLYLDEMMQPEPLTPRERGEIDALFNVRNADPDQLLRDAAASLATLTRLAAVSATTIPRSVTVRRVEIIPAGKRTVVILLVASSGVIRNKVCRVDFELTEAVIRFFVEFAQKQLMGRSLEEITTSYLSSVSVSLGEYARLFMPIFAALYDLVREINDGQYFAQGTTNLLSYQELSGSAYELLRFIEQAQGMQELLSGHHAPVQVLIGRESAAAQLSDSSVIIARYNIGSNAAGAIGVIGPVRMNYARLLPHLEYFAFTLGKLLSETYTEQ